MQPDERDQGRSAPDKTAMDQGMRVLAHLISGILIYGALGWVGDHFLHTMFLLPIGIVVGAGLGIYTTIKRIQFAESAHSAARTSTARTSTTTEGDR